MIARVKKTAKPFTREQAIAELDDAFEMAVAQKDAAAMKEAVEAKIKLFNPLITVDIDKLIQEAIASMGNGLDFVNQVVL